MRWTPGGVSGDVEDRRDEGGGGFNFGGFGGMHIGIGGALLLLILSLVFKTNFFAMLSGGSAPVHQVVRSNDPAENAREDREVQFVSFVLDDVQRTWDAQLPRQANVPYHHAKLVLFRDYTESGCGTAQSATGPFYCPVDEKVYIDLAFFRELRSRFGAPGEFAQAYVVAHEVGHHIQKLLGTERQTRAMEQRNPGQANAISVGVELQADCYAGVWGNSTEQRNIVDNADIQQGLAAAAAVGDDRLQRMATGHVSPESFTHGSSADRMKWFQRGLTSGRISACKTFE
ncbi:MAG TPA: neutral zinc metallopeptidase [Bryobacteraceae bacterium]